MVRLCPEFVSTAESFASNVIYIPVSAMGQSPQEDPDNPDSGALLVRPKDIKPTWATVPLLSMLALKGLIPAARRKESSRFRTPTVLRVSGDRIVVSVPEGVQGLDVPRAYLGCLLRCPESGKWFRMAAANQLNDGGH